MGGGWPWQAPHTLHVLLQLLGLVACGVVLWHRLLTVPVDARVSLRAAADGLYPALSNSKPWTVTNPLSGGGWRRAVELAPPCPSPCTFTYHSLPRAACSWRAAAAVSALCTGAADLLSALPGLDLWLVSWLRPVVAFAPPYTCPCTGPQQAAASTRNLSPAIDDLPSGLPGLALVQPCPWRQS